MVWSMCVYLIESSAHLKQEGKKNNRKTEWKKGEKKIKTRNNKLFGIISFM